MSAPFEVSCLYRRDDTTYRYEMTRCKTLEQARHLAYYYRVVPPKGCTVHRGPVIKQGNVVVELCSRPREDSS